MFPICHTHTLAVLSHYFKSVSCVYSVMFSLQRRCTGCHVPFSDPRCFLPVTVCDTTSALLVHMCWPWRRLMVTWIWDAWERISDEKILRATETVFSYSEAFYRSFGPPITFVLHVSCWQSINAKLASPVFCLLASVERTAVCPEIPLQSPPPPLGGLTVTVTVSPLPPGGGRPGDISRGRQGISVCGGCTL